MTPQPYKDEEPFNIVDPEERLLSALKSGFLADMKIHVGDKEIECHYKIVSFASSRLASVLKRNSQLEMSGPLDIDLRHIQILLEIIYGGSEKLETPDWKTVLQLGYQAHALLIPAAMDYCSDELYSYVNTENLWEILKFAEYYHQTGLMEQCSWIFDRHFSRSKSFLNCESGRLPWILKQEKIAVTELQLFQACLDWTNAKPNEVESRRAALGPALGWIRFRTFSAEDFAKYVMPTGLLSAVQERDILHSCVTGKNFMPHGFSVSTNLRGAVPAKPKGLRVNTKLPDQPSDSKLPEAPEDCDEEMPQVDEDRVDKTKWITIEEPFSIAEPTDRLLSVLDSGFLADVRIVVGREEIKCHSDIVSFASPKLADILREKEPRLPDIDPRHFRSLLRIIYGGTTSGHLDTDTLLQVGRMAHDLHVYPAVVYCAERLLDFHIDYLCSILDFGELIQDPELIQRCVEVIQNKAPHIFEAESFLHYTTSKIEVILRQETIYNVTELQLFQACLTWSNGQPNEVESRRAALGPVLGLIRFRLISTEDFGKHVCPTGLLSTEHERDILRSCATGEDYMPEGFSNSTKSRDPSQLMVLKICSSGERNSLEEFIKQKRYSSFQFHVNKESFIHGVQLLAFRSNLPDGQVYDEHVRVSIEHQACRKTYTSTHFHGQVKNGDTFTVKFKHPFEVFRSGCDRYTLHVYYAQNKTSEGNNLDHDAYMGRGKIECDSGLVISWYSEFVAPPGLHMIIADKVPV